MVKKNKKIKKISFVFFVFFCFSFSFVLAESKKETNIKIGITNKNILEEKETEVGGSKGGKSHRISTVRTCKDKNAVNYNSKGIHFQKLCLYKEKETFLIEDKNIVLEKKDDDKIKNKKKKEKKEEMKVEKKESGKFCLGKKILSQNLYKGYRDGSFSFREFSVISEVEILQTFLNKFNYNSGVEDGIFGEITEDSVKRFQSKNNLKIDGIVGKETRRIIKNYCLGILPTEEKGDEKKEKEKKEVELKDLKKSDKEDKKEEKINKSEKKTFWQKIKEFFNF